MSIHWRSPPPPPYTPKTMVLLLQVFFKDTLYFYLSTFCFQYFLHLFKSFSLLVTSTTRVQIQSNLGTTGYSGHTAFTFVKQRCLFRLRRKIIPLYLKLRLRQFVLGFGSVSLLRRLYSLLRSLIFINFSLRLGADCSLKNFVHQNALHPMTSYTICPPTNNHTPTM